MALPQGLGWAESLPFPTGHSEARTPAGAYFARFEGRYPGRYGAARGRAGQMNRWLRILGRQTDAAGCGRRESRVEAGSSVRSGAQSWATFGVQEEQTRSEVRASKQQILVWPAVLGLGDSEGIMECSNWTLWGRVPDRKVRTHGTERSVIGGRPRLRLLRLVGSTLVHTSFFVFLGGEDRMTLECVSSTPIDTTKHANPSHPSPPPGEVVWSEYDVVVVVV